MARRRWSVGALCEMAPEGLVGVDPVCTLGLNVNKGARIHLRLRTDDGRGFRKYLGVKKARAPVVVVAVASVVAVRSPRPSRSRLFGRSSTHAPCPSETLWREERRRAPLVLTLRRGVDRIGRAVARAVLGRAVHLRRRTCRPSHLTSPCLMSGSDRTMRQPADQ
jgi:hypothetical protein